MTMMTKIPSALLLLTCALCAQTPSATKSTAKSVKAATKSTAAAPQPVTIPKDAVANPNGSFSWTDKQGKKWLYSNTPFGVIKSADGDGADASSLAGVTAFDAGEKVRFEKPSPFGPISWVKSKTDLTSEERSLFDSQTATGKKKQE